MKKLFCLLALIHAFLAWGADGDVFYANSSEGVEIAFKIISESNKTVQVGDGTLVAIDDSYEGILTLPNSVLGYQVVKIGQKAFYMHNGLSLINIPGSVEEIEREAFYRCKSLRSISIPNKIKSIARETFMFCENLTTVALPNGITSIEYDAFYGCI